ncbi:MAG TPA: type II toxin-antitoxin system YafQ family toxin [Methanocorpusculum sp.]|nr:type II toxin-antitoxin system YafQ family toxin [Methanocorpusculum sp.]HJK36492.1 type II toxin-antitoxin system YafQ family toxin [Methanocorpusculum sp.]HJK38132.1 type II toxin-antitoxin system YafQ family toxin [Methanocorpusculum sp.]HJK56211.1 type II toxin-antitoxin system YafQ family toxin [Methanocorpusculum sp.]HJK62760.1 type II toxin-antitoxin system YafQ family toxin [Methanocorpusculum sp.]
MYEIKATGRFKKDIKLLQKRGYNIALLQQVIEILARGESLPKKYADHGLNGEWSEFRECHIQPDWLLIYRIDEDILILTPDQNRHTQRSFLSILHGRISRMTELKSPMVAMP